MSKVGVGIPWYRREEFDALRALFPDGDTLHDTFDEWLAAAEELEEMIGADVREVVRVTIDPKEFLTWCMERGVPPNARARSVYAGEQAKRFSEKPPEA